MRTWQRVKPAMILATWVSTWLAAPAAAGEPDLTRWPLVAAVQLDSPPAKGLVEVSLTPEVFARARADLGDLRLTDGTGRTVPYVLRLDRGEAGKPVAYEPARMYNPVFTPGKQSAITVDFGARAPRTGIDVVTPGTNFRRRVMVEASQDAQAWQVLRKSDWLFSVSHEGGRYVKTQVKLPDNDFRYLRVTVFHAPDDPERVSIEQVRAWYVKATAPETVETGISSVVTTQPAKIKATDVEADLGFERLPVHEVAMSFGDVQFLRRVEVFGRDYKTRTIEESVENAPPRKRQVEEPWRRLAEGVIHRFPPAGEAEEASSLRLSVDDACRYLLLRIHDGDDPPLKLTGLKVYRLRHYLAFQATEGGPYRLYFGSPAAAAPQYDLAHYADRLRAEGVARAGLSAASANPSFAPAERVIPWSERYKWPLWAALIAILVVLGVLVARQARRAPRADGRNGDRA